MTAKLTVVAGAAGGALVGLVDAWLAAHGAGANLPVEAQIRLALIGGAVLGALGGFGAGAWLALVFVARAGFRRWMPTRVSWAPLIGAMVAAAPVVLVDAIAMFKGARAARIPGHQILTWVLIALGLLAAAGAARGYRAIVAPGTAGWGRQLAALGLLTSAILACVANARVLPRLYPWFHHTLTVLALVAAALAGFAALSGMGRRRGRMVGGVALLLIFVGGVLSYPRLGASPELRFFALEKAAGVSWVLASLPLPRVTALPPAAAHLDRPAGAPDPLPAGPRVADADVLLLTIDALRASHVGAYGYPRATTPNIDKLAASGVRFEQAYAQAPHTSFSVASLLTGKYYATLARVSSGGAEEPLPTTLKRYGVRTAAFYPPAVFFVDGDKLAGFRDSHFQFEYVKFEFLDAFERLAQLREYFASAKPERAFVWVHLFEPHEPYDARAQHDFGPRDIDRYDSEIAYADAAVGRLLELMRKRQRPLIVVLTADHGEEFDEHGGRYHGTTLYEEQIRVPLLIAGPGINPGVVRGPVELVDVAPTVLGLLGIPAPSRMRGTDLGPWLAAAPAANDRLPPAFAELDRLRMIATGNHKLICRQDTDTCELFDLAADPGETRNQAAHDPRRFGALRAQLAAWVAEQTRLENPSGGAGAAVVPPVVERGRLGDVSVAPELLRLAREGPGETARVLAARTLALLPPPAGLREELLRAATPTTGTDGREAADWLAVAALAAAAAPVADGGAVLPESGWAGALARVIGLLAAPDHRALQSALVLAQHGRAEGVPTLLARLPACASAEECRSLVLALGRLRAAAAVPSLLAALDNVMVRRDAVEALGAIGDARALPPIAERLRTDEYVPVRAAAAHALGRLGHGARRAQVAGILRRALASEAEQVVRDAIAAALSPGQPPTDASNQAR